MKGFVPVLLQQFFMVQGKVKLNLILRLLSFFLTMVAGFVIIYT